MSDTPENCCQTVIEFWDTRFCPVVELHNYDGPMSCLACLCPNTAISHQNACKEAGIFYSLSAPCVSICGVLEAIFYTLPSQICHCCPGFNQ